MEGDVLVGGVPEGSYARHNRLKASAARLLDLEICGCSLLIRLQPHRTIDEDLCMTVKVSFCAGGNPMMDFILEGASGRCRPRGVWEIEVRFAHSLFRLAGGCQLPNAQVMKVVVQVTRCRPEGTDL